MLGEAGSRRTDSERARQSKLAAATACGSIDGCDHGLRDVFENQGREEPTFKWVRSCLACPNRRYVCEIGVAQVAARRIACQHDKLDLLVARDLQQNALEFPEQPERDVVPGRGRQGNYPAGAVVANYPSHLIISGSKLRRDRRSSTIPIQ